PARVWVPRVREDLTHRAFLDDLAAVHDADAVAHARDAAEIVTDEQDRGPMASTQLAHEVEHRGLDRDVEARRGLVHDQERRTGDERHRDDDALLLTAGKLMRIALHHPGRIRQLDLAEHRDRAIASRTRAGTLVGHRHFHELAADRHHRIEARHRI